MGGFCSFVEHLPSGQFVQRLRHEAVLLPHPANIQQCGRDEHHQHGCAATQSHNPHLAHVQLLLLLLRLVECGQLLGVAVCLSRLQRVVDFQHLRVEVGGAAVVTRLLADLGQSPFREQHHVAQCVRLRAQLRHQSVVDGSRLGVASPFAQVVHDEVVARVAARERHGLPRLVGRVGAFRLSSLHQVNGQFGQ